MNGPPPGPGGGSSGFPYWLKAAVSLTLAGLILSRLSTGELWGILQDADVKLVASAVAVSALTRATAAFRLRRVLELSGFRAELSHLLHVNLAALFYTLVVPGGNVTAAAIRVSKIRRRGVPGTSAGAAVVRDRLDATLAMVLVGVVFFALDPAVAAEAALVAFVIVGGFTALAIASFVESPLAHVVDRWIEALRLPLVEDKLRRFWSRLRALGRRGPSDQISILALSFVIHLLGTAAYFLLAHALDVPLSFARLGWVRAAVLAVTTVPVSLGGVGVREAAFLLLLPPLGIAREAAVALSLLVFGATVLVFGMVGGCWEIAGPLDRDDRSA